MQLFIAYKHHNRFLTIIGIFDSYEKAQEYACEWWDRTQSDDFREDSVIIEEFTLNPSFKN